MPIHLMGGSWVNEQGSKNYNLRHHEILPGNDGLPEASHQFLADYLENLDHDKTGLKLAHKRKSPMGHHLNFIQTYQGTPIYGSEVKVNLAKDYQILSLYQKTLSTQRWQIPSFNRAVFDSSLRLKANYPVAVSNPEVVIFYNDDRPRIALKVHLKKTPSSIPKEVVYSQNAEVLYEKALVRRAGPDTVLSGYVFLPDPLTTAEVTYGSPYVNSEDANIAELNQERKSVPIAINTTPNPDTFFLRGPHVRIVDNTIPENEPAYSTDGTFDYKRAAPQFEEVNVYYHLHRFATYIQKELGLNIGQYQIEADAHGTVGDNSSFEVTGDSTGRLIFGDGGVDDGEDADAIIHEYGHALSHYAEPDFPEKQWESEGLEEGIADYLACSYSKNMNAFGWERLYNWDGHNEFWDGRACTTNKNYPDDLVRNIYRDGNLWAGRLMKVREALGRQKTDRLLLTSLYNYASTMTMEDAATQLMLAEEALYQKKHRSELAHLLDNAGFIEAVDFTGIEKSNSQNPEIEVFNNGQAFQINSDKPSGNWRIHLQSVNGKVLGKWKSKRLNNFEIPNVHLAEGVYLIRIFNAKVHQTFRVLHQ